MFEVAGILTGGAEGEIRGETLLGQALVFNVAGCCLRELVIRAFLQRSACAVGELDFLNAVGLDPAFVLGSRSLSSDASKVVVVLWQTVSVVVLCSSGDSRVDASYLHLPSRGRRRSRMR